MGDEVKRELDQFTEFCLAKIEPYNRHKLRLNKERSALLVIDMQNYFVNPQTPSGLNLGTVIIPRVKALIEAFRTANRPVIFTRHIHHPSGNDLGILGWWWEGAIMEGSLESEIYHELAPLPQEKVILKHRYSAFYNTDLEIVLRCLAIEDLVISGVMTNLCCESTARDAYFRDFRIFFIADATATANDQMHLATLLNLAYGFAYITTTKELISHLGI